MRGHQLFWANLGFSVFIFLSHPAAAGRIETGASSLKVDGKPVPYLFGAETQYFRARGGSERNVDRNVVLSLWTKLLDQVKSAHMNLVSLYIPWDFHEPKEGVFDFDGRLDQDGDHNPDYPSRDLKTFLHMVEARGIKYAMLRPGPYINAEWGPTGFGAIPLWFLKNYPQALNVTQTKNKPKTAAFFQPIYREHVRKWFRTLYEQVLKDFVGPNKLGVFIQLDNETNFFWDSVYERDYSDDSITRYRAWLSNKYETVSALNKAYGANVTAFDEVVPPKKLDDKTYSTPVWHYDWFRYHDLEIRDYFKFLREAWRDAGLSDSQVLFTRCDSFNTTTPSGLLPRLDYGQKDQLALTTLNIYPKTDGTSVVPTLNTPFKAAHDASLLSSSHESFFGDLGHWLMATETIGGWFPPVKVSLEARQHTYGSLIGSDVKAMTIYYFHEGYNWSGLEKNDTPLLFDTPLDKDMNPRDSYKLISDLGKTLEDGLGERAVDTENITSPILIAHDSNAQYPVPGPTNGELAQSNDSAGIFGAFREMGVLPEVGFIDSFAADELLRRYKLIVLASSGYLTESTKAKLKDYAVGGGRIAIFGGPDPKETFSGRLNYFSKNIFADWNSDLYVNNSSHRSSLAEVSALMTAAGITPTVTVTAADGDSFVHVWLRPATDNGTSLLFVENFLSKSRQIKIGFNKDLKKFPAKFKLARRWSNLDKPATTESEIGSIAGSIIQGVSVPVTSDGVDIWEVTPIK